MTVSEKRHWTAEQSSHPDAKADGWVLVYDPMPGGRLNADGRRTYSLRFPALLISDCVGEPEDAAKQIADLLNTAEELGKDRSA